MKVALWNGDAQCCDDPLPIADLSIVNGRSREAAAWFAVADAVPGLALRCGLANGSKEKGRHADKSPDTKCLTTGRMQDKPPFPLQPLTVLQQKPLY